ncbi:hypothetical protein AB1Y20_004332 [Prymnesium parvum]|uniref:peptidylprolyl isomerase n=1 Tax=Prymnesium parvum TaxID=97485 RepID=A0AB34IWL3_PRYPA|mmetsp:Transcript_32061/g.79874  ORF Transcript_32061/g.79874 Transcript_32061/m.79874 type:complete len:364 (+) Transcript_32061:8-1099(+)
MARALPAGAQEEERVGSSGKAAKEDEDIFKHEREAHEKLEKEVAASWEKRVRSPGSGRQVAAGNRVTLHIVGHLHSEGGVVFESTRQRGVPVILIARRGSLVPGLDVGLLSCCEGEQAVFTVQPSGGYGNRGYVDANAVRKVPGDCVLVFEVEIVKVEEELELWNLDYETKMRYAAEYRERGNTLFRNKYYDVADEEYEQAMRYLIFNTHPTEAELPHVSEGLIAVQLNLTATKLRTGREKEAIAQAKKVLELMPNHPKALYRIGQAHVQLGNYREAERYLGKAITASEGDAEAVQACQREIERLSQRQERHKRQQKKAYSKMIQPKHSKLGSFLQLLQDPTKKAVASFAVAALAVLAFVFFG